MVVLLVLSDRQEVEADRTDGLCKNADPTYLDTKTCVWCCSVGIEVVTIFRVCQNISMLIRTCFISSKTFKYSFPGLNQFLNRE